MIKKNLIFSILFAAYLPLMAQWTIVGAPNFADTSYNGVALADYIFISVAPNGDPYVIYRTAVYGYSSSSGRVMKFNGSEWELVGSSNFSAGDVSCTTMAFDKFGTPYIAYIDKTNCSKATVMKLDGSNWIYVGNQGFSTGGASYTSIAIDTNGIPYVAFRDQGACVYNLWPNGYRASVMKFDGTNWNYVGTPAFSPPGYDAAGAVDITLAIDKNNTPYVAFSNFSGGFKATVLKFDGINWVYVGDSTGISAGSASFTSIVIDSYKIPYVAYTDYTYSGKATVMKFDGNNWIPVGQPGFTPSNAETVSIAIDSNNKLYLSFMDYSQIRRRASVMTFDGNNWVYVGAPGFSDSTVLTTSIAVDKNKGILYTAFEAAYNEYNPPFTLNATVKKFVITATGINEIENEGNFSVYPNPTKKEVVIQFSSQIKSEFLMNIKNSLGQTVYSEKKRYFTGEYINTINLSKQPQGVYFIEVIQNENRKTKKIIIE